MPKERKQVCVWWQKVASLRTRKTMMESRLKSVEEDAEKLREDCALRDSRIAQLEMIVEDILTRKSQEVQDITPSPGTESVAHGSTPEPTPRDPDSVAARHRDPEVRPDASAVAREIAAGLDLRVLGGAIASALQWRTQDSDGDSESDLPAPAADPPRRRRAQANHQSRAPAAPPADRPTAASGSGMVPADTMVRPDVVTGAGPASNLILDTTGSPQPNKKFILQGFHPDATDREVRSLVWGVVRNLHDFQRLSRRDDTAKGQSNWERVRAPNMPNGLVDNIKLVLHGNCEASRRLLRLLTCW